MTEYVLIALACGGLAWLASLYFTLQKRVSDLERVVDQQRTDVGLSELRDAVGEMVDELRGAARDSAASLTLPEEGVRPPVWRTSVEVIPATPAAAGPGAPPSRARRSPARTGPRPLVVPREEAGSVVIGATRRDAVLRLARQGLPARAIAERTNLELGGVELLLRLERGELELLPGRAPLEDSARPTNGGKGVLS